MKRAVVFINQFFGGVGGEDEADFEPIIKEGAAGSALAIKAQLKGAEVTHTVICGDNFINSHQEEALARIKSFLDAVAFDIFIAGPAFQSGRYGMSCGAVCKFVRETYCVPAVTSMNEENPGVDSYRLNDFYILRGGKSATKMRQDVAALVKFADKILAGEELLGAEAEGYFPRGIRKEVFVERRASDRAVDMLLAKMSGKPYETEYRIEVHDKVAPAPAVKDITKAKIAFVNTGGLVPVGNPDRMPSAMASAWKAYDISALDSLKFGEFYSVHGGFDASCVNADPERLLPLSALRELTKEGKAGAIEPRLYTTTGNLTTLKDAARMGKEIAEVLKNDEVDGVIFVST